MRLSEPVQVRFKALVKERLKRVSDASGLSESELVRQAVDEYLDRVQKAGSITIPLGDAARVRAERKPRATGEES